MITQGLFHFMCCDNHCCQVCKIWFGGGSQMCQQV